MRLLACLLVLMFCASGPAGAADSVRTLNTSRTHVQETRLGQHPGLTRLVLDVSELTRFYTSVAEDGVRVLVGIASVDWDTNRHRLHPFGLITRFDFMRRGLKRGLLVIHTRQPVRVDRSFTLGPDRADERGNRLVIDLVPQDAPGKKAPPRKSG